jgi:phosphoheptose isomerase
VEDGKTGSLVKPDDPDALALKIYELLQDPDLLKKMSHNAIRRVNFYFTWTKVAEMMENVYERVLQPHESDFEHYATNFAEKAFDHAIATIQKCKNKLTTDLLEASRLLVNCFLKNKKVLVCGNGGSAAESQHFTAELVGRFELNERKALPVIALTADTSIITAWSNDFGFEQVFARQVEAYGQKGDVLLCFSTSGQSENVVNAMKVAIEKGMVCIALSGKGGGEMTSYAHVSLIVPSNSTQRIQELHLHLLHTLCYLVEVRLFGRDRSGKAKLNGNGKIDTIELTTT